MEVTDGSFSRDDLNKLMSTAPIGKSETLNLNFFGKGSTYFGIVVLNVILTIVTFGLYYPWAKAAYRKYLWNETEFKDSRFVFNGTGKEMFKGFVIAYIIIIGFYASLSLIAFFSFGWVFTILFFFLMMMLFPFAIFGGWRYRVTRTSWRGIFFSFDGNLKEFMKIYFPALILTIITLGIYGAWMRVKLQKYLFRHTKIGNLRMDFHGNGGDLFVINLLGAILFYPSLGMYTPIWMKQLFNFTVEHTTLEDGEKRRALKSNLQNKEAWLTIMGNFLMLVFTLGIAFPWTMMRSMRMYFRNVEVSEDFNFDELTQSEDEYSGATGDEMMDILDIGLDF